MNAPTADPDRQYFGIKTEPATGRMYVGLLNPGRTAFLTGADLATDNPTDDLADYLARLHHEDCTDLAIGVVAEHLLTYWGGKMGIAYDDGRAYKITIEQMTPEELAADAAAAAADHSET